MNPGAFYPTAAAAAFLLALGISPASLAAQAPPGSEISRREVAAVVERIFEGMRTADAELVRSLFADEARFAVLDVRDGPPVIRGRPVTGWIEAVGRSGGRWDERVYDMEIQVDGPMASVWAPYTFYLDGEISHCGVNSIELLHDADGWKVTQISDTRRQEGCPDPMAGG